MIATVGDTITHVYGPGDHRIWQVDHATSTWDESWTIRDLAGNVVRRLDKVGPTWSFGQDWIRRDGSLLAAALPGGLERHYHLDHLGSARLITQQTGTTIGRFAYLPFGEDASEVSANFPETMRFTGHERDGVETTGWADDLDYMRARYCSPRWGRFLSVDPARESARVGVPQSWNRYSYGLGNPVKYVDPDGRDVEVFVRDDASGGLTNFGHTALRVVGDGYDLTYDFGRYGDVSGVLNSSGEGVLRVWSDFSAFLVGQLQFGNVVIARYETSSRFDQILIAHFEALTGAGVMKKRYENYAEYALQNRYNLLSNNCTTICGDALEFALGRYGLRPDRQLATDARDHYGDAIRPSALFEVLSDRIRTPNQSVGATTITFHAYQPPEE